MADLLNRVLFFFVRLVLLAVGLVFAASLLVAGALLALAAVVAGVLTGRRPTWRARFGADPRSPWQRFRRPAGSRGRGAGASSGAAPARGEIIDAEVREIVASEKV